MKSPPASALTYELINRPPPLWLAGINLSGADLRCAPLSRANLRDADLSEAKMTRAHLGEADLRGANLLNAELSQATCASPE